MKVTRATIVAILDSVPRLPNKHKQRIAWELFIHINQLKLWQEEEAVAAAQNPAEDKKLSGKSE